MASPTLSGVRPPARITRRPAASRSASVQSKTSPEPGVRRVDQDGVDRRTRRPGRGGGRRRAKAWMRNGTRAGPRPPRPGSRGRGAARRARPGVLDDLDDPLGALVAEHADGRGSRAAAAGRCRGRCRGRSGAATEAKIEPDRVGAHRHGEEGVLLVGDPTDLHEHAADATARPRPTPRFPAPNALLACVAHHRRCERMPERAGRAGQPGRGSGVDQAAVEVVVVGGEVEVAVTGVVEQDDLLLAGLLGGQRLVDGGPDGVGGLGGGDLALGSRRTASPPRRPCPAGRRRPPSGRLRRAARRSASRRGSAGRRRGSTAA